MRKATRCMAAALTVAALLVTGMIPGGKKAEAHLYNGTSIQAVPAAQTAQSPAANQDESYYQPVYDFDEYLELNPDVRAAYGRDRGSVFRHFLVHGMKEGRTARKDFSVSAYRASYEDLRKAFGDDWSAYFTHYIEYGVREGRSGASHDPGLPSDSRGSQRREFPPASTQLELIFDAAYYTAAWPDLKAAFGDDADQARQHFLRHGMSEGRRAREGFDPVSYRRRYPDLDAAFGDDWMAYYIHYYTCGVLEKRNGGTEDENALASQPPVYLSISRDFSTITFGYPGTLTEVTDGQKKEEFCRLLESIPLRRTTWGEKDYYRHVVGQYCVGLGDRYGFTMTSEYIMYGSELYAFRDGGNARSAQIRAAAEALGGAR